MTDGPGLVMGAGAILRGAKQAADAAMETRFRG